ncbi:MAG: heme-binding protein [Gammaproteobacteria bacterium]|nr:heme-binding protein [Gammaproteobacteria bacterium]MDH3450252.1 heme-binding protein [Gammaproteobacteria bacterium]
MEQKNVIDLETAKAVAAAAQREADANGWDVVIAIVDDGGHLMYLQRSRAQLGSIDVAIKKARAAVLFRRPTSVFADRVNNGQPGYLEMPGIMPLEGGEPLEYDGEIVGAIGISGAKANEDGIVARAGCVAMPR